MRNESGISLAVISALDDEICIVKSKMEIDESVHLRPSLYTVGALNGQSILLARSGLGISAMKSATKYCIERYHPKFFLHVGYCGGADPTYQLGDLVIAKTITEAATENKYESDFSFIEMAKDVCQQSNLRAKEGNLVTVNEVIGIPHEKAFIGTKYESQAIDMESSAFAEVCAKFKQPCLVVRASLDPLDMTLPHVGESFLDEEGNTDGFAIVKHLIKRPKDLFKFPRMQYAVVEARRAIDAFIEGFIQRWPLK